MSSFSPSFKNILGKPTPPKKPDLTGIKDLDDELMNKYKKALFDYHDNLMNFEIMVETIKKLENEPKRPIFIDPNDNSVSYCGSIENSKNVCAQTYTVNGIRYELNYGENLVPETIYNLYLESKEGALYLKKQIVNNSIIDAMSSLK